MADCGDKDQGNMTSRSTGSSVPPLKNVRVPYLTGYADIAYLDTGPCNGPVCLAFHGAPGGIHDLVELNEPLTSSGIRLIVPEFPGNSPSTVPVEWVVISLHIIVSVFPVKRFLQICTAYGLILIWKMHSQSWSWKTLEFCVEKFKAMESPGKCSRSWKVLEF